MELEQLRTVFRNALELPGEFPVDELEYRGNEKWDSLAHMSLVAAIEDGFGVMLDTDEVIDLSSFDRARQILEKHGVVLTD
ncbi:MULTISPECIES: acyl carrier protein [Micromonospora]|uniref:Acyl carrier protein n=1 Tax=Micromonospora solifontis TaxID=2487138 RepID=A0ABX9WIS5_9ACTN|nr:MULTISPECIES: phosphopantetheine-binding protein [Micromonospora]NES15533.1 acyl carrier protein [Micromonospora sp. PPF5-17B]NES36897.1 acyl carrier protein [Micromonospora solifontis]NES55240.1 acyl carrier protein [Micromonospora sp. PPF5-6]RNL98947.1 acyl carrier protein [Micromonospora solifontis]